MYPIILGKLSGPCQILWKLSVSNIMEAISLMSNIMEAISLMSNIMEAISLRWSAAAGSCLPAGWLSLCAPCGGRWLRVCGGLVVGSVCTTLYLYTSIGFMPFLETGRQAHIFFEKSLDLSGGCGKYTKYKVHRLPKVLHSS